MSYQYNNTYNKTEEEMKEMSRGEQSRPSRWEKVGVWLEEGAIQEAGGGDGGERRETGKVRRLGWECVPATMTKGS